MSKNLLRTEKRLGFFARLTTSVIMDFIVAGWMLLILNFVGIPVLDNLSFWQLFLLIVAVTPVVAKSLTMFFIHDVINDRL